MTPSEAPPLVRVRDLSRRFGALVAVDALSLEVGCGEMFGLIGPDGAGKTTTLRMLLGLLAPASGTLKGSQHLGANQCRHSRPYSAAFGRISEPPRFARAYLVEALDDPDPSYLPLSPEQGPDSKWRPAG